MTQIEKLQKKKKKLRKFIIDEEWGNGSNLIKALDDLEGVIVQLCIIEATR